MIDDDGWLAADLDVFRASNLGSAITAAEADAIVRRNDLRDFSELTEQYVSR